ncbi:MAG: flagellar basal body rod protein FlgB [Firmicutes bacterium]|nr:flagellar basal body rod protein FlgB [Bacillota bacterium]
MLKNIFMHSGYLEKALDASWLRNEVIANNISNVDTPNFKSSRVEFESALKDAFENSGIKMKKTDKKHMDMQDVGAHDLKPSVVKKVNTAARMDGNNVDIETEQLDMVKNVIYYNLLIQKIGKEFGRIKTAINEGK